MNRFFIILITFVCCTAINAQTVSYYKLTKKRIFPMAPIHHSFEKWGYTARDIVKLFWIVGFICSMIAIVYGVWL